MKKIIFATGNQNKVREINEILEDMGFSIVSMKEAGIDIDIVEDGTTFEENAMIKATAVYEAYMGELDGDGATEDASNAGDAAKWGDEVFVMADDSGLSIDYLNGEPGIYSARYLGEETPYTEKNKQILERLSGVPKEERSARFVCAVACVFPNGEKRVACGTIEGEIGLEMAGENGFGYDPIFYVEEYGCTTAQMLPEQKNAISHRGRALRLMRKEIEDYEKSC